MKLFIGFLLYLLSFFSFAQEKTLTIYTTETFASQWGPGTKIKNTFEKKYNCKINYQIFPNSISIINRLKLEKSNTKANIILGIDQTLIHEAEQTNLFGKNKIKLSKLNLPVQWKDKYFIPYDYGYFAFIYNNKKLKSPPKSLSQLINDKNISVVYEDPRMDTAGTGFMLWMKAVYGKDATKMWKKLSMHTLTVTNNWTQAFNLFRKGEADMVLSYTTDPAYSLIEEKNNSFSAASFSEGHYMQIQVAGYIKRNNSRLTQDFMSFILSKDFQNEMPTGNWMYPVIKTKLPKEFDNLIRPKKSLLFSPVEVFQNKQKWQNEWENSVSN